MPGVPSPFSALGRASSGACVSPVLQPLCPCPSAHQAAFIPKLWEFHLVPLSFPPLE